jgi:hypothetical protein
MPDCAHPRRSHVPLALENGRPERRKRRSSTGWLSPCEGPESIAPRHVQVQGVQMAPRPHMGRVERGGAGLSQAGMRAGVSR